MKAADCGIRSCHPSRFPEGRRGNADTLFRRPDFVGGNAVTIGWLLLLLTTVLLWLLGSTPVRADGVVGNGTPESCTQAALHDALLGGGLVTFDCGVEPVIITLTTEEVSTAEMGETIVDGGELVTLSGDHVTRIFNVNEGGSLEVRSLTIANGLAGDGAGILNEGTLTVTNSTFSGNSTTSSNGIGGAISNVHGILIVTDSTFSGNGAIGRSGAGGAIFNSGTLDVTNSTFSGNYSVGQMWGSGGAVVNSRTLTVADSTFSENSSDDGGGISNWGDGTVVVTNTNFFGNHADTGAGISNWGDGDGTVEVTNSTFSGNIGIDGGGGIFNANARPITISGSTFTENSADRGGGIANADLGVMTVSNCTIFGNTATLGGGISNNFCPVWEHCSSAGTLTIFNSTITNNSAEESAGGLYAPGAVTLVNTLIANNTGGGEADDCGGNEEFTHGGHNLLGGPESACGLTNGVNDNIVGVDPMLDPEGLGGNGGLTQTVALLLGSPAIDAGDPEVCANPPVNGLDQRGYVRPGTGSTTCSIGAYEFDSPGPPPCTGDCDENGQVEVHELVTLLNIGLGIADVSGCEAGDRNSDGEISINEIVAAVGYSLAGCPLVPDPRFDRLARVVEAEMAERGIRAAAIAVVEDGKVAYVDGFGTLADDDDTPVDADTLFAIGSLTKSFTAVALLSAIADDAAVTLDTPVQDILPEFAFPPAETQNLITLRTLLEQTSTLPRNFPGSVPDPADASTQRLLTDVLPDLVADGYAQWAQPGHIWQYSNLGFDIAGLAAEAITGSSYPDLVRDRLTTPLGLERTFARAADIEAAGNFALGAPAVTPASLDDAARRPAGGLWSSARDMANYLVFQLEGDDRVLSQTDHAETQSPLVPTGLCLDRNYGLGLFVSDAHFDSDASVYYPVDVVRHDGAVAGFHAEMDFFPKRGDGYVILTASDDELPDTWRHLDTAVFDLPSEPRPDLSGDPEEWARWEGTFYDPHLYGTLIITRVGDELHAELPDLPAGFLRGFTPVCGNVFFVDTVLGGSNIVLTEDLAGEPNLIRIVLGGVFERVP